MINFGGIPLGSVLPVFFDSYAGSTGASATISGLSVTDIEIYKGVSMTQRSSDNGYTLLDTDGIDLDGITGINGFSIDTGDNSDAGFFAAGSFYNVVVSAITVDSQTVNFVAATFRVVAAEGTAGTPVADATRWNNLPTVELPLVPTTAGRKLDVSAGGEAGLDWANIGSPTTAVVLSGTTIGVVTLTGTLTTYTGNTPQTGDSFARLGAPAGASVSADIAAAKSDTAAIKAKTDQFVFTVANQVDSNVITKTGFALTAAYNFATGTAAMTEAYAANGVAPTPVQAIFAIHQMLMDFAITATAYTVKKLDNSTTAFVVTLDSATLPTSAVRT